MNHIEAMKQALDALENVRQYDSENLYGLDDEITALRQSIEQAEKQEPVAWSVLDKRTGKHWYTHESKYTAQYYANLYSHNDADGPSMVVKPLYTAPPQREWQGLTDEDIESAFAVKQGSTMEEHLLGCARAIEAKLKEKNGL